MFFKRKFYFKQREAEENNYQKNLELMNVGGTFSNKKHNTRWTNDAHKEVKTVRNSKSTYVKERKITEL